MSSIFPIKKIITHFCIKNTSHFFSISLTFFLIIFLFFHKEYFIYLFIYFNFSYLFIFYFFFGWRSRVYHVHMYMYMYIRVQYQERALKHRVWDQGVQHFKHGVLNTGTVSLHHSGIIIKSLGGILCTKKFWLLTYTFKEMRARVLFTNTFRS